MCHCIDTTRGDEIWANSMYGFEFELRQYSSLLVDLDLLRKESKKSIPAAAVLSGDEPAMGPIAGIGERIGKEIVRLPISYMTEPEVFAKAL